MASLQNLLLDTIPCEDTRKNQKKRKGKRRDIFGWPYILASENFVDLIKDKDPLHSMLGKNMINVNNEVIKVHTAWCFIVQLKEDRVNPHRVEQELKHIMLIFPVVAIGDEGDPIFPTGQYISSEVDERSQFGNSLGFMDHQPAPFVRSFVRSFVANKSSIR